MSVVPLVLYYVLLVFLLLLIFRLVMEYVFMLARNYRPGGPVAIALEICYTATDPPYKALQRVLPPLRIGNVSLDLAFVVLFSIVVILMNVVRTL